MDSISSVWVPALIWYLVGDPFQRGFYCDDTSIRFPYKDSTVTDVELMCYSLVVPIILVKLFEKISNKMKEILILYRFNGQIFTKRRILWP